MRPSKHVRLRLRKDMREDMHGQALKPCTVSIDTVTWVEADAAGHVMMHVSSHEETECEFEDLVFIGVGARVHWWPSPAIPTPPSLGLVVMCWRW